MRKLKYMYVRIAIILLMVFSVAGPTFNAAASPLADHGGYANPAAVDLLTVENFAALADTAVSSPIAGTNLNDGDLGIRGVGCTNFPTPCSTPGIINGVVNNGAIQNNNAVANTGDNDSTTVVTDLNGGAPNLRTADATIASGLLDGLTLGRGVYDVPAAVTANLTGVLTLHGGANAIFIFRFASTFVTGSTASVVLTGGAQACNVYWTSVAETTFNDTTSMVGTVFAGTSVTFPGGGAVVDGRVIAQTAAITFNNTTINNSECAVEAPPEEEEEEEEEDVVTGLPDTGGGPIRNEDLVWIPLIVGGFSVAALALGVRAYRRTQLPKQ